MKKLLSIISFAVVLITGLALDGCVHEFPQEKEKTEYTATIDLVFDLSMPVYEKIEYIYGIRTMPSNMRMCYRVAGWRLNYEDEVIYRREPDFDYTFYDKSPQDPDYSVDVNFFEDGTWCFVAWADLASLDGKSVAYNNDDITSIELIIDQETGEFSRAPYTDCFAGQIEKVFIGKDDIHTHHVIEMKRPVGEVEFFTTDADKYVERIREAIKIGLIDQNEAADNREYNSLLTANDWSSYTVRLQISGWYPCLYNAVAGYPTNSAVNPHTLTLIDGNGIIIDQDRGLKGNSMGGFMMLCNEAESFVYASVYIYNSKNEVISASERIRVPLLRGDKTIVYGDYLTIGASSGITIDTSFSGDYDVNLNDVLGTEHFD